jgi:23S rRNA (guanine745-N1)-methyltransferase
MVETDFLICPICGSRLEKVGSSFLCISAENKKRHCFDISSAKYSDLSYRSGGSGDPKDAVTDRTAFLDKGYYLKLSNKINDICRKYLSHEFFLIYAGCGEGYYSERIAAEFSDSYVFGADLSKHAVHRASVRRNIRGGNNSFYAVSSIFSLPVIPNSSDCVLSMFAPVAEDEILRVLKKDGLLIIGAAAERHLYDLKKAIYPEVHLNDERADLPQRMKLIDKMNVTYRTFIEDNEDITRLFGMTLYRFRTSEESLLLLQSLSSLDVEISVDFYVYQKTL